MCLCGGHCEVCGCEMSNVSVLVRSFPTPTKGRFDDLLTALAIDLVLSLCSVSMLVTSALRSHLRLKLVSESNLYVVCIC